MRTEKTWRRGTQAVLAAAGVALVTISVAAGQPQQTPRRPGMRSAMPFAHLNLTDDRRTRVKEILEAERESGPKTFQELSTARDELRAAIYASASPDTARIDELVARVAELEAAALRARVATELRIAAILTDEQRQELATARPRRPRDRREPGGPGNPSLDVAPRVTFRRPPAAPGGSREQGRLPASPSVPARLSAGDPASRWRHPHEALDPVPRRGARSAGDHGRNRAGGRPRLR